MDNSMEVTGMLEGYRGTKWYQKKIQQNKTKQNKTKELNQIS